MDGRPFFSDLFSTHMQFLDFSARTDDELGSLSPFSEQKVRFIFKELRYGFEEGG